MLYIITSKTNNNLHFNFKNRIDATGQNELEFICSSSGIVELIDLVRKYYDDAATLNTLRIFKLERVIYLVLKE